MLQGSRPEKFSKQGDHWQQELQRSIPLHQPNHYKFSITLSSLVADLVGSLSWDPLPIWNTLVGLKAVNINRLISTHDFKSIFTRSESSRALLYLFWSIFVLSLIWRRLPKKKPSWDKHFTTVFIGLDVSFDFLSVDTVVSFEPRFVYPVPCITCKLVYKYVTQSWTTDFINC